MADLPLVLFVIVDVLGVAGAVLVTIPILGEIKSKGHLHLFRSAAPLLNLGRAETTARQVTEAELLRFKPQDGVQVSWGLGLIILSYLLHILAEILEHQGHH